MTDQTGEKRFERLNELFIRAHRLDEAGREQLLDDECAGDAELRRDVEALLKADARATRSLQTEMVQREVSRSATSIDGRMPDRIGPYKVIRLIGEGGMGAVYEAEQEDPRRRVAIKVIRPGMLGQRPMSRFRHEAQVLGQLRHPGIAQIYEAGTADRGEGGQPWFAMELVDGHPLRQYAAEHHLGVTQRLELVAMICDALQHAHEKGIVHRDLKPANILVEDGGTGTASRDATRVGGQPKILDFGVARLTDADVNTVTLQTKTGEIIGTVPYMSPEQASGDPAAIDVRSDIYAVGVIAFELLSGRLPLDVRGRMIHDAVRVIREDEPSRLGSIDRTLRGDVETIVAKALEKDRDRRYRSAAEMAADIRRYLSHEPIIARPPSTIYQLRKFARRHRALVAATAVVMLALATGTVVSTAFAVREADAAAVARAVNEFLNDDLLGAVNPDAEGRDLTMLEALDIAATKIDGRFPDQPAVEAEIRSTIGNTYLALGEPDRAIEHLERALEVQRDTLGERHEKTMTTYNRLGRLMHTLARFDEAEKYYGRSIELRREVLGPEAPLTITTQNNLASVYRQSGRFEEAMELYIELERLTARVLEPDASQRLNVLTGLAGAYKDLGRYEDAIPIYEQILDTQRRTNADKPALPQAMNNLAVAYRRAGRLDESRRLTAEAVDRYTEILTERHPSTMASMTNLARVTHALGNHEEAETLYRRSLEVHQDVLGRDHRGSLITQGSLGQLYRDMQRYGEAESEFLQVIELAMDRYGPSYPGAITGQHDLAALYLKMERSADALPLAQSAADAARGAWGEESPTTAVFIETLGKCFMELEQHDAAEPLLLESHGIFEAARGPTHGDTLKAVEVLAHLYERWGRDDDAAAWRAKLP